MSSPLKNATLRQLATFHTLARLGSVSRTAEEMHLSQPAISLQLGILEDSAGMQLLSRSSRGVKLTSAGELLAVYAGRMLTLWREAAEALAAQRGQVAGTLRVGAVTTAEYLLPQLLLEFVRLHPQVKVKLQVGNRAEIIGHLSLQEVDLAIMGRPPADLKTSSAVFARHPMAFVAAPSHALMAAQALTLNDLNAANLLVRERGSGTRSTVEHLFKEAGVELAIGSEMASNEAIKQMCAAGFGVAFLSLHACVLEMQAGLLAKLPLAGQPIERDWYVIALSARPVPAAAVAFEAFLKQHGQTLINLRQPSQTEGAMSAATAAAASRIAEPARPKPRSRKREARVG